MNTRNRKGFTRFMTVITYVTIFSFIYENVIWAQGLVGAVKVLPSNKIATLDMPLSELKIVNIR